MGDKDTYQETEWFAPPHVVSHVEAIQAPALLVSMPNLNDPYFQKTVILLCDYTEEHAYGMVINRPSTLSAREILADPATFKSDIKGPLLVGGPVSPEFMWALHSPDFYDHSTTKMGTVFMSSIQEVLRGISQGSGPAKYLLGSGYAGWGPGQLDQELTEGAWWIVPLDASLILDMPYDERWQSTLETLGISPLTTSFYATGEA